MAFLSMMDVTLTDKQSPDYPPGGRTR